MFFIPFWFWLVDVCVLSIQINIQAETIWFINNPQSPIRNPCQLSPSGKPNPQSLPAIAVRQAQSAIRNRQSPIPAC